MTYTSRRPGIIYQHLKHHSIAVVAIGICLSLALLHSAMAQSILGVDNEAVTYRAEMKQHFAREVRKLRISPLREASLVVAFRVDRSGRLSSYSIARPSGDPYVDRKVENFLSKDLSFSPFPANMKTKQLDISVPIVFRPR